MSRRRRGRRLHLSIAFAIPALLFVIAFRFAPSSVAAILSFSDSDGTGGDFEWVGWENYVRIFQLDETQSALVHTLQLGFAMAIGTNLLGLLLALMVHTGLKSRGVLRALFFVPIVLMPLASSYAWRFIFAPDGLVNAVLGTIGLEHLQRPWLGDPQWALLAVLSAMIWQWVGLPMAFYIARLETIPPELNEAALVDGASTWDRFRFIKLPLLAPTMTTMFVLMLITGLKTFDQILAMTGGGPVYATETIATQIWRRTFQYGEFGLASALSVLFAVLVVALSGLSLAVLKWRERRVS